MPITHMTVRQLDDDGYDWDILARDSDGELSYSDDRWGSKEEALANLHALRKGGGTWWPEAQNSADRSVDHDWVEV